jgi:hypothetical protein
MDLMLNCELYVDMYDELKGFSLWEAACGKVASNS